jgi:hypothetical protein
VSDEFTVPLCAIHHTENHGTGNERQWWLERKIDPLTVAHDLWNRSTAKTAETQCDSKARTLVMKGSSYLTHDLTELSALRGGARRFADDHLFSTLTRFPSDQKYNLNVRETAKARWNAWTFLSLGSRQMTS